MSTSSFIGPMITDPGRDGIPCRRSICWGHNPWGATGKTGFEPGESEPVDSDANTFQLGGPVTDLALGGQHSCAQVGERTFCWGGNPSNPELHDAPCTDCSSPNERTEMTAVVALDSGADHVCGLDGSGQLWCFGAYPTETAAQGSATAMSPPVVVATGVAAFTTGIYHVCYVDDQGAVFCQGSWSEADPTPFQRVSPGPYRSLSGGLRFTCAITMDRSSVECWGTGANMRLGSGVADTNTPVRVPFP